MMEQSSPVAPSGLEALASWRARYPQFAALVDSAPSPVKALRYLGLTLWQGGRLDDAEGMLTAAVALAPSDATILTELASVIYAAGRKAQAKDLLASSLAFDPRQPQAWLTLASICNERGDKTEAEEAFLRVLELEPASSEAAAGLGLLYIEQRRFEEAATLLTLAVERGAASVALYACLGQACYMLGEFAKAKEALGVAARACPENDRFVRKYAEACLVTAALSVPIDEALDAYRAAAGEYAEDLATVCRRAFLVLGGYGRREAAIRFGEALAAHVPDDTVVRYHLDALTGRTHDRAPTGYVVAYFDRYAPDFDRHLVDTLGYRLPKELPSLLAETGERFPRILDLGCGTGLASPYLAGLGDDLTGVDVSPRMLEKARERNLYARLIEDDAVAYLSSRDDCFDLIVSLDVFIYFGDLSELLAAAAARLAQGGVLAFSYETGQGADYTLLSSGRFAHDPTYVERLCARHFTPLASLSTTLRLEANHPVAGRLVLMRRT